VDDLRRVKKHQPCAIRSRMIIFWGD
jgi:hypothetical protein